MAVAGMVLGIVACAWLIGVHRKNKALRTRTEELEFRLKDVESRLETHLGRLNDLQSLLETAIRVNDAHSEQIINLAQRADELEALLAGLPGPIATSLVRLCDRINDLEQVHPHKGDIEPSDGPLYLALRYERHHTKRPSGEVGKMPVFSSVELIQSKYGPNCGYKRLDLPEGGQ